MDACPYKAASHFRGGSDILPPNWLFCLNTESDFGQNDTVMTMGVSDTLPEALLIMFTHVKNIGKHLSSNGCMLLQHRLIFPRLTWCPKVGVLLEN